MGIFIKGMKMPKNCDECSISDIRLCKLWMRMTISQRVEGKHPNCPLVEVQSPHGRLIDADALNTYDVSPIYEFCVMGVTEEDIGLAPTIIEAEGRDT